MKIRLLVAPAGEQGFTLAVAPVSGGMVDHDRSLRLAGIEEASAVLDQLTASEREKADWTVLLVRREGFAIASSLAEFDRLSKYANG